MLPLYVAPGVLVGFMVLLAVVPLVIIWLDERRGQAATNRLIRLRSEIGLREHLAGLARVKTSRRASVALPGA